MGVPHQTGDAMTSKPRLLPCPFCQGTNIRLYYADGVEYAQCHDCTACGPDHDKQHWNERETVARLPVETSPRIETPDWRKLPFHPSLIPALRRAESGGDRLCGAAADALQATTVPKLINAVKPRETSGLNPLNKRVHVACKDNVSSWEYPHLVICFKNIADLHAAALYLSSSPLEPTARQHVIDHAGDCKSYCWCKTQPEKASEPHPVDDGQRLVECPSCHGVGGGITKDGVEMDCSTCNGEGGVLRQVERDRKSRNESQKKRLGSASCAY
jgi:hypothetical protein